jgi:hypothetical protein
MSAVLHHSRSKGTDKLVLLGIANHYGDGGAWPTVATLARYANATERTVQRSLSNLVRLGELAIIRQGGGTQHMKDSERPNRYDVLVRCPQLCDGSTQHRMRGYPQAPQLSLVLSDSHHLDPVTPASPPDAGVTPPGDVDVTQTVPTNSPVPTSVEKVTTTRAREKSTPARDERVQALLADTRAAIAEAKR